MKRSLELPRFIDFGLEDIELQEEASLGLECGNGQMDLASHFQTGVQENQTIMKILMNILFIHTGIHRVKITWGIGVMSMRLTEFPLFANAGTFF